MYIEFYLLFRIDISLTITHESDKMIASLCYMPSFHRIPECLPTYITV